MKKLIIGLISFTFLLGTVHAQDAKKLYKQAKRDFGTFSMDQSQTESLRTAKQNIDQSLEQAMSDSEQELDVDYLLLKGEIYNAIANQVTVIRQTGIGKMEDLPKTDNPALAAFESFKKANEMAEKRYQEKDAVKGLQNVMGQLSNLGIYKYEDQQFEAALANFEAVINAHKMLSDMGEDSGLGNEEAVNDQYYITGLAALNAGNVSKAKSYFIPLYEAGVKKPAVYEGLYQATAKEDSPEEAYKYLKKGREIFPEETSLLFAEINHYLKLGKLDELIKRIDEAIAAEPNNISLYSVKGNVFDNLYQKALEQQDSAKADEYFTKAQKNYEKALEIDPEYVNAVYSLGALYYNKAAQMTQEMNKLADDYSKEGMAKYDAIKKDVDAEFEKALPYFKRAEKIDPNDLNTLIALKEIYARKGNVDLSNEFKTRLENVQAGVENEQSYFENNNE